MDAVSFYLYNVLTPALQGYGVSDAFCKYITEIIGLQMNSLLRHWEDVSFRKTVLLIGLEEGTFYEPASKIDVKCFVVMTIRNSPLETIQSASYSQAGLNREISDKNFKAITAEAIRYFSKQNFSALCSYAKAHPMQDYYYDVLHTHPVTAAALKHIANASSKAVEYPCVPVSQPYDLQGLNVIFDKAISSEGFDTSVYDGYTSELEPPLAGVLQEFASGKTHVFVTDSFKSITRNFEKLIRILEFLLTRDIAFVTSNFYLENGHTERRMKPLKAGHNGVEMQHNLIQTSGLGYKHKSALNMAVKANG